MKSVKHDHGALDDKRVSVFSKPSQKMTENLKNLVATDHTVRKDPSEGSGTHGQNGQNKK